MQSVFVIVTKLIASGNIFCKEVFCNNFGRDGTFQHFEENTTRKPRRTCVKPTPPPKKKSPRSGLRGRTTTKSSKKGSEKVLGRVLRKGSAEGFSEGFIERGLLWALQQKLGTFKQGVSKQGVMTFAWRPGSQYDVAARRCADIVLASDCRAQFGRPSTRRRCRICVTVRLPVRPRRETMYWQANANTPLSVPPF